MPLNLTQQTCILESDLETPVGFFIRLVGEQQGILLESAEVDGKWGHYSIIACDFVLTATCRDGLLDLKTADPALEHLNKLSGKPYIAALREIIKELEIKRDSDSSSKEDLPPITRALYGYLGYGVAGMLEAKLAKTLPPEEARACMVLPGTCIVFDHVYNKICQVTLCHNGLPLKALSGNIKPTYQATAHNYPLAEQDKYIAAVRRVKEEIRRGEAIQVVLSTNFKAPLSESPFSIYRNLRRVNPSPYMFYMRLPDGVLLGSSPEVLISCSENRLRLCPIAGTRPRSQDQTQDIIFSDELLNDPKEKAEHVMLVDLGRNDLGRVARTGSVRLDRFMEVERFSHVMHMTSRISAELEAGCDAIDLIQATFPAGTVSGAPKIRAMELIAQEEQTPRGPYAGAMGWIGLDKDVVNLDLGLIIRSLWVQDGHIFWQAGAGIVHDSIPEMEWQECCAKAAVIRKVVLGDTTE